MDMAANMQKNILEIVDDFSAWRGNSFTLASLIAEAVKENCASAVEAEHPEAASLIRGI